MPKILVILSLLVFASCDNLGGSAAGGGAGEPSRDFVGQAQQTAEDLCRFVPTAQSITAIIAALYPAAIPAQAGAEVGNQICQAVMSPDRGLEPPVVAGVTVEGTFVE